jgi:hypothetical protein
MRRFQFKSEFRVGVFAIVSIAGCAGMREARVADEQGASGNKVVALSQNTTPSPGGPKDAQSSVNIIFRLQTYQLCVPAGTISRNEAFWKRIDEHCVDVATAENLLKNGFRVGLAPLTEWEHLNNLIQQNPGTASHADSVGREAKNIELEMRKSVPYQTISYIDADNQLRGASFDRCENIVNVSYQPTPRKVGSARISLAPMVRTTRKRLEFSPANNEEREIVFKSDESFYLNLVVDVPVNNILVLAPSSDASAETSLGHAFLMKDDPAEQFEQVILIFPRPTRIEGP